MIRNGTAQYCARTLPHVVHPRGFRIFVHLWLRLSTLYSGIGGVTGDGGSDTVRIWCYHTMLRFGGGKGEGGERGEGEKGEKGEEKDPL